jgi:hypothetical protein
MVIKSLLILNLLGDPSVSLPANNPLEGAVCSLRRSMAAPWHENADLSGEAFNAVARLTRTPPAEVLGPYADYLFGRGYSVEEFKSAVADLSLFLVEATKETRFAQVQDAEKDVYCWLRNSAASPLIAYIDPTCGHCDEVLKLIRSAKAVCEDFPPTALRLLPSSDDTAIEASARLLLIRDQAPDQFCGAVAAFVNVLPSQGLELSNLWADFEPYLGDYDRGALIDARRNLVARKDSFPGREFGAPLVVYRGKRLHKVGAFNPFSSKELLVFTVRLLDLVLDKGDGDGRSGR